MASSHRIVKFGVFELDLRSGELRKKGVKVRLQEQSFRLLAALLEQPGQLITRGELRSRLWPDGTFVDFEHSLNAAIRRLRAALGDEPDVPRFVETLHRRGYRFVGSMDGGSDRPGARTSNGPRGTNGNRHRMAVLPFSSIGDELRRDVFSDGLTEETIARIARTCAPAIGVIARTSVNRMHEHTRSAAEIGRTLDVDYLLEGSVRAAQGRVRITTQLIDAAEETHLWAEVYDRENTDCFAIQQEVATLIARGVANRLLGTSRACTTQMCTNLSSVSEHG